MTLISLSVVDLVISASLVVMVALLSWKLYLGSEKIAAQSAGPGTVLPSLLHGGPGRAGGGEELGGERGLKPFELLQLQFLDLATGF